MTQFRYGGGSRTPASNLDPTDYAAGPELVDLGEHVPRDLSGATRLFQVRVDGLPSQYPLFQQYRCSDATTCLGRAVADDVLPVFYLPLEHWGVRGW